MTKILRDKKNVFTNQNNIVVKLTQTQKKQKRRKKSNKINTKKLNLNENHFNVTSFREF